MTVRYWLETDFHTDQPETLYRAVDETVELWNATTKEWRTSVRSIPELEGLGGYVSFTRISPNQAEKWRLFFMGQGPDPSKPAQWNFDPVVNADPNNAEARKRLRRARR